MDGEFEEGEEVHEENLLSEPSEIKRKRSRIEQNLHKGENPDEEYVFSNIGESIQDEDDTGFENTNSELGEKENK